MEAKVDFIAVDNPHATRLTLHILAAVAEHERDMISQRTKAALPPPRRVGGCWGRTGASWRTRTRPRPWTGWRDR